jgi:HEAT repeat protein
VIANDYWTKAALVVCGIAAVAALIVARQRPREEPGDLLTYYSVENTGPVVACLRALGSRSVPVLLEQIRKEKLLRSDIVAQMTTLGPDAVPYLVAAFDDSSPKVRLAAIRTFVSLRGDLERHAVKAVPPLLKLMRDPNVEIRYTAALAWRRLEMSRIQAVPALIQILRASELDPDDDLICLRMVAVQTLGRIGPEAAAALPDLARVLREGASDVSKEVLVSLWRITQDTTWIQAELARMLADPDAGTRSEAAAAARRLCREAPLDPCLLTEAASL